MRLKTSITLSLALWMGAVCLDAEAATPRRAPTAARKPKKEEPPPPPPEPTPEPVVAPPPPPPVVTAPPAPVYPWSGKLVVLTAAATPGAQARAQTLETQLREALGAQGELQLVTPEWLFPSPPAESMKPGDGLFTEGKDLYDNLDPEAAVKKFASAAAFYEQHPVDMQPERLARVYIFLGASHLLNGDLDSARAAFTRAVLAAPSVKPESDLFGPDVHEAFAAARKDLEARPKGTLLVDSAPSGAQVTLRGEPLGTTPLKNLELPPGPHPLAFTLPGHVPYGVFQTVTSGKSEPVRPTLEPLPGLAEVHTLAAQAGAARTLDESRAEPPPEVARLGEKLGARYVVLAVVGRDARAPTATTLYAWDLTGKNRLRGVKLDATQAPERQRAVLQVRDFATGKIVPDSRLPAALVATVKKPWFWAAVGGVAVATTAGILLANQGPRPLGPRLGNFGAGW
ncbi:PEGA domain-containing protein [Archangium primigenium]|uniref:PEGA domain-containing protein n=1 Tax=[Archangium] primigenium TaxID=2792470 RepID=UPI00195D4B39|nr:PEGA domain-containing protein [Archangium primigenium]